MGIVYSNLWLRVALTVLCERLLPRNKFILQTLCADLINFKCAKGKFPPGIVGRPLVETDNNNSSARLWSTAIFDPQISIIQLNHDTDKSTLTREDSTEHSHLPNTPDCLYICLGLPYLYSNEGGIDGRSRVALFKRPVYASGIAGTDTTTVNPWLFDCGANISPRNPTLNRSHIDARTSVEEPTFTSFWDAPCIFHCITRIHYAGFTLLPGVRLNILQPRGFSSFLASDPFWISSNELNRHSLNNESWPLPPACLPRSTWIFCVLQWAVVCVSHPWKTVSSLVPFIHLVAGWPGTNSYGARSSPELYVQDKLASAGNGTLTFGLAQ